MSAVFACSLVIGACGGDDDDDTAAPAADGTSDDTAATDEADADRSDWPDELVLAAVPADNSQEIDDIFGTTIEIIEGELGIGVEFFEAIDYAGVIEAAKSERVDAAVFGPFSYDIATQNDAPLEVGGVMMPYNEDQTGPGATHGYQSFFITGSPIALRTTLPASLLDGLRDVIQNKANVDWATENGYCTGPEDCSFSDEDSWGWTAADDSIYAPIDELCQLTQAAQCEEE
jgi:ABC-type phosphate/phosphonate transport system substrate-binding protein